MTRIVYDTMMFLMDALAIGFLGTLVAQAVVAVFRRRRRPR